MVKLKIIMGIGAVIVILLIAKLSTAEPSYRDLEIQPVTYTDSVGAGTTFPT